MKIKLILTFTFLSLINASNFHSFQDHSILDKMQIYLTNSKTENRKKYQKSRNFNSKRKYRCYNGETNFIGQISEKALKSKNNECELEITYVKMKCKNEGLENLVFALKNNFNKKMLLKTPERCNRYYRSHVYSDYRRHLQDYDFGSSEENENLSDRNFRRNLNEKFTGNNLDRNFSGNIHDNFERGSDHNEINGGNLENNYYNRPRRRMRVRNDKNNSYKRFIIPEMKFVKKIIIGSSDKKVFCYRDQCMFEKSTCLFSEFKVKKLNIITSIEFVLSDNTKFGITCSKPDIYQEKVFSDYQRVTGINYNFEKNYITKLNFYFHTLTNLNNKNKLNYYNLLKNEENLKNKKGNYIIGPIGKKKGIEFKDLRRYSDWKLSAISVISDKDIFSVQSEFKNIFFKKYSSGKKFGNITKGKLFKEKVFKIAKNDRIKKIVFFIDNLENLKGFGIFLENTHQIFGIDKKDNVKFKEKDFLIAQNENVFGLLGYYFEGKIVSLGFMVNNEVLDNLKSFS